MLDDRFEILFVCHANLCRSPLAERLARQAFDEALGVEATQIMVSSAGTHAFAGSPMHAGSAQVLNEYGIVTDDFTSRPVTPALLTCADLVLTAAREQRAACVTMAPATIRRTFTVRQFARFTAAVPPTGNSGGPAQRLDSLLTRIASVRHLLPPVSANADDLPDPVGMPVEAFRACADELGQTMRLVTRIIAVS